MASYTTKQQRNFSEAALTGQPSNDTQSDDAKFSVAETKRLWGEAQARIDQTRNPNEIGSTP